MRSGRLLFHDLVSEEELYELYMRSDLQIVPEAKGTAQGAIPSKLPNLIKAGVAIFAICEAESDIAKILKHSGIGCSIHSWKIEEILPALSYFIDVSAQKSHKYRQQMTKDFVGRNFSIDRVVREIID